MDPLLKGGLGWIEFFRLDRIKKKHTNSKEVYSRTLKIIVHDDTFFMDSIHIIGISLWYFSYGNEYKSIRKALNIWFSFVNRRRRYSQCLWPFFTCFSSLEVMLNGQLLDKDNNARFVRPKWHTIGKHKGYWKYWNYSK